MWNLSSSISINKQLYTNTNTNTISDREIHVSMEHKQVLESGII